MGNVSSIVHTGLFPDGGCSLLRLLSEVSVLPAVFPFSIGRIKLGGARRNFFLRLPDGEVAMGGDTTHCLWAIVCLFLNLSFGNKFGQGAGKRGACHAHDFGHFLLVVDASVNGEILQETRF